MEKYVTVVSVDDQLLSPIVPPPSEPVVIVASSGIGADRAVELSNMAASGADEHASQGDGQEDDSQFVTVLSINHGGDGGRGRQNAPEVVLVYRLPGERLGFGLKFQGGTKSNEKIQRLFIQSCAENSPASRVQASWGHLREGDEILEIDGVSVSRMTRIECVKCLKDSNVAIKLLVRNGEGKVQNFYGENGSGAGTLSTGGDRAGLGSGGVGGGELPERKGAPPPPPPVPPRKLNKRKQTTVEQQNAVHQGDVGPPPKQSVAETLLPPPDAESYSNLFADDISDLISESDDTASTISTVVDKFSICSSLSSEDYTIPANGGPAGILGQSAELAKALKPFTLLEQEFNLENKFETTNLFTFKPPAPVASLTSNVVQLEVPGAEKPPPPPPPQAQPTTEYENVTIMKVDENRNYENVTVPYGPYENVTIQTVQPYENMVLSRSTVESRRRQSANQPTPALPTDGGVYENVDLKALVPPRPLPRQGGVVVEPKKRAPIPVPIPIVVAPPRMKPAKVQQSSEEAAVPSANDTPAPVASTAPLGSEFNTIQSWLQEATEVIHECALNTAGGGGEEISSTEEKAPDAKQPSPATDLPRLIDFHPKVSVPLKALEEVEAVAPPASPVRFDGTVASQGTAAFTVETSPERYELPPSESVVRKCIKILSSEDHTYIESSSSDEDEEKLYGRSEDEDDRSSSLSREATTTPEQFLSGDGGYSDEDGEKLGPPEIVSGGPSEAYFNFPWTSNLLPPIGEVEEEFSSLEHQHNGPIVIINTAEETVINDTNNNQQRQERKKPIDDESAKQPHSTVPSTKIVIRSGPGHHIEPMSEVPSFSGSGSGAESEEISVSGDHSQQIVNGDQMSTMDEDLVEDYGEEDDQDAVDSDDSLEVDNDTGRRTEQAARETQQIKIQTTETVSDEKVNNESTNSTDKTVAAVVDELSTCPDSKVMAHVDGGVDDSATADAEVNPIECSPTMEENAPGKCVSGGDRLQQDDTNQTIDSKTDEDAVDESNIDAICGDVDIVVGDTVESDFEELVKAQVEPLDVDADSSEQQIQQIHERIIVGIERAVSDEVVLGVGDKVLEQNVESSPEQCRESRVESVEPATGTDDPKQIEADGAEEADGADEQGAEEEHPAEQ
uniref:PDZ domain-containing protein n=1 Tax=Anopheles farauti TaxID=69004 RepID=A0A182QFI5_9DIPT